MTGFLSVLLTIILFFYLIGFLVKLWFRYLINKKMNNPDSEVKFGGFNIFGQNGDFFGGNRQNKQKKEGEISVSNIGKQEKKVKDNVGEYVEFEEINDTK